MKLRFGRGATLAGAGLAVIVLLGWLSTTQGPLAPAKVTLAKVAEGTLVSTTFGIGTVEARRSYALGPTVASRVARVLADQGDAVRAGQVVAELDPVDLEERVASAQHAAERAASATRAAEAQLAEAQSRAQLAGSSARRYAALGAQGFVSQEAADAKETEARAANSAADAAFEQVAAARRDHDRARTDGAGIVKVRAQARLASPTDGIVTARLVEPGTTIVAGQAMLLVIDPKSLWVKARIDQGQAGGVRVGQAAEIVLRSAPGRAWRGEVQRVDWVSDAVTEERIVNVGFAERPEPISVGDLVEVTIRTGNVPDARYVPAAAIRRVDRQDGVWQLAGGRVAFRQVKTGITTHDGRTQILAGLDAGDEVVVHSERALAPDAKVRVVAAIVSPGS